MVEGRTTARDPRIEYLEGTIEFWKRVLKITVVRRESKRAVDRNTLKGPTVVNGWTMHNNRTPREQLTSARALSASTVPKDHGRRVEREREEEEIADPDASNTIIRQTYPYTKQRRR